MRRNPGQREREASLLAQASTELLQHGSVHASLRRIAGRAAEVLGTGEARIELGSLRRPDAGESAHELAVGDRRVGTIYLAHSSQPNPAVAGRVLPALASILAVAVDRERLALEAVQAEALRRSDAVKTAVLRAVSHDLRSPLTAILAAGEGLQSPLLELDESDRAALLETIRLEAKRLDRLVGNLLDLSLLEAGAEPRPQLWTADGLVAGALEAVGPEAERVEVS